MPEPPPPSPAYAENGLTSVAAATSAANAARIVFFLELNVPSPFRDLVDTPYSYADTKRGNIASGFVCEQTATHVTVRNIYKFL